MTDLGRYILDLLDECWKRRDLDHSSSANRVSRVMRGRVARHPRTKAPCGFWRRSKKVQGKSPVGDTSLQFRQYQRQQTPQSRLSATTFYSRVARHSLHFRRRGQQRVSLLRQACADADAVRQTWFGVMAHQDAARQPAPLSAPSHPGRPPGRERSSPGWDRGAGTGTATAPGAAARAPTISASTVA